jgi:Txe/YoeB family toxin of Txe-Axe toxin-antitoxin module
MKRKTKQKKNALEILPDSTDSNPYEMLDDKEKLVGQLTITWR